MTQFENFGDAITLDHVDANAKEMRSFDGDRDLLVIYDLATGCLGAYPVKSKNAGEVLQALVHFAGGDTIKSVYSDRAPMSLRCEVFLEFRPFTQLAFQECLRPTP